MIINNEELKKIEKMQLINHIFSTKKDYRWQYFRTFASVSKKNSLPNWLSW